MKQAWTIDFTTFPFKELIQRRIAHYIHTVKDAPCPSFIQSSFHEIIPFSNQPWVLTFEFRKCSITYVPQLLSEFPYLTLQVGNVLNLVSNNFVWGNQLLNNRSSVTTHWWWFRKSCLKLIGVAIVCDKDKM